MQDPGRQLDCDLDQGFSLRAEVAAGAGVSGGSVGFPVGVAPVAPALPPLHHSPRLSQRAADLRSQPQPLLVVVHGRSGGLIPPELEALAAELAGRRGAPVQLVALSGGHQEATPALRASVLERGGLGLVPLLLLPGGHVRHDLSPIATRWRQLGPLHRYPFLGAWSRWQQQLAGLVDDERRQGRSLLWLHHPIEGALPQRYLAHLARHSGAALVATPYTSEHGWSALPVGPGVVWQPLVLAANRLTEGLQHLPTRPPLRPPLLHQAPVRQFLLQLLEALP